MQTKYIREGRFGPPKTWKTGSIVATYPKPMLVLLYEPGGLEVSNIPQGDISYIGAGQLKDTMKSVPSPIVAVDLCFKPMVGLDTSYMPSKDSATLNDTTVAINAVVQAQSHPFKTIVLDSVTGLDRSIWSHQAVTLGDKVMLDARKWAGNIGLKLGSIIDYLIMPVVKANVVFIFHTEVITNEAGDIVGEYPMVHSKLRQFVHNKFSQFFYQQIYNGKPVVRWKPFEQVRGLGTRWPTYKNELLDPTFQGLYSGEPNVFQ